MVLLHYAVVALVGVANAVVHSIDVGNGGIKFIPNSLTANNGDQLEFHFFSGTGVHSVVSSTFENPCVPVTNGFFSGYVTGSLTGETTFVVNVSSTEPIWFYCSLASHCEAGMVGVVNPPLGKSVTDYANAAKNAAKASAPASLQGGVLATISAASSTTTTTIALGNSVTDTIATGSVNVQTTMPTLSRGGSMTTTVTTSAGSAAATTQANGAGKNRDLDIVVGLGLAIAALVTLIG